MKVIGMIGGIGPESTIDYYKRLLAGYDKRCPNQGLPAIVINSIDVKKALALVGANQLRELTDYFLDEIVRLARAGAECGLLSANTPHIIFDELSRRSPLPLVSIVEAAGAEAKRMGLKRIGLFGTRFTMQGQFYPAVFSREGIALIVPTAEEQTYIHVKYVNELIPGKFLDTTREGLLKIARRMKDHEGIEGLILGGTELPLILTDNSSVAIPFLDTTEIHVNAVLEEALR
ncbi:MAG TPA: amino acid racemase [Candidatus Angelobacter sp.]|jgi:aspartate racemase